MYLLIYSYGNSNLWCEYPNRYIQRSFLFLDFFRIYNATLMNKKKKTEIQS